MKKFGIYTMMVAAFALGACNEIDEADRLLDYTAVSNDRSVLLEEFTGQWCPNCPEGASEAHRLQGNYSGLVVVSIHAGGFAAGTPYVTEAGNVYWEHFYNNGDSYPAAMINRSGEVSSGYQREWSELVHAAALLPVSYDLSLTTAYDETTRSLTVTSEISKSYIEVEGDIKLLLLLTEDGIVDAQLSSVEGLIPDYEHNHVLRGAIGDQDAEPNYWGVDVEVGYPEATEVVSQPYLLDEAWVAENMNVVGILYDAATYEVLQVEEVPLVAASSAEDGETE